MKRNNKGQGIAEAVAATVLIIPMIVLIMFVLAEISQFFYIQTELTNAARQAARALAVEYSQVVGIDTSTALQQQYVFNNIRFGNIVGSSAQFSATFNETNIPNIVSVTTTYTSGKNGCPVFPNPDPLKLGNKINLSSTATYELE